MAEKDIVAKEYLRDSEHFCEFINAVLFNGKGRLNAEYVYDLPTELNTIKNGEDEATAIHTWQRFRDVVKCYKAGSESVIFAVENQTETDFGMPLRVFVEDALEYDAVRKNKIGSYFHKEDVLPLVITVVFYYGGKEWSGAKSLGELISVPGAMTYLEKYRPDYPMILVTPESVNTEDMKGSWKEIFEVLKRRNRKEELEEYLFQHRARYLALPDDAKRFVFALIDMLEYYDDLKEKGETVNMCKAIDDIRQEGFERGMRQAAKMFLKNGASMELVAASITEISPQELREMYNSVCGLPSGAAAER